MKFINKYLFFIYIFFIIHTLISCNDATSSKNHSPIITDFRANPDTIDATLSTILICDAEDPDGDDLTFSWFADDGDFTGQGNSVIWTSPDLSGIFNISCKVNDNFEGVDSKSIQILVNENPFKMDANDYNLYSHLLNYYNDKNNMQQALIYDSTQTIDITNIIDNIDDLKLSTLYDFQVKNEKSYKIETIDNLNFNGTLISKNDLPNWKTVYPNASCIFYLSRIGFNPDKTQALVYYVDYSAPMVASAHLVLFEKVDNWLVKQSIMIWIS